MMCFIPVTAQYRHTGKASFYHDKFVGRKTASGIIFSNDSMFCAHRTLPFGTMLEVTNLKNNRTCIVKVVDRGPYIKGRIIDLTYEAAKHLGFHTLGTANVYIAVTDRVILPFTLLPCDLQQPITEEKAVNTNVRNSRWREVKDLHLEEK